VGGQTVKILYEDKKIPTDWKSSEKERGDHTYMKGNFGKINEKAATSQDKIPWFTVLLEVQEEERVHHRGWKTRGLDWAVEIFSA
jgi:hypothetical protein